MDEIEELTKPIVKYMKKNYNPHTTIIITNSHIKVVEDKLSVPICTNIVMNNPIDSKLSNDIIEKLNHTKTQLLGQ